jgi:uncharacterized protein
VSEKEKKQQKAENEARLGNATANLQRVALSDTTPRKIKKVATEAIAVLQDAKVSISLRAANAVSTLNEIMQDPNMPSFARVMFWSAVSELESIRE